VGHDQPVVHLLNLTSACVLFYAAVTRGGRAFARLLEKLAG
jgi:hypothetical protein